MNAELLYLLVVLAGAFGIGWGSGLLFAGRRGAPHRTELEAAERRLDESLAELERTRGHLDELRGQLADAVDRLEFEDLRVRYHALQVEHAELERRVMFHPQGLSGNGRRDEDALFSEQLGLSITGEVPPDYADELTRVRGISPYIEDRLRRIGIRTYDQISRLTDAQVRRVNEAIELLPGRIRREDWVGQCARLLMEVRRNA